MHIFGRSCEELGAGVDDSCVGVNDPSNSGYSIVLSFSEWKTTSCFGFFGLLRVNSEHLLKKKVSFTIDIPICCSSELCDELEQGLGQRCQP